MIPLKFPHVKYLGVWLYSTLNMKKHISEKCRIASLKLYNVKRIRKYLSHDSLVRLVNALVLSHLDFCNALLICLPDSTIRPLQNVQNSAARVTLGLPKFEHISPGLKKLHWLLIKYRIEFKFLTMVFKTMIKIEVLWGQSLLSLCSPTLEHAAQQC